MKENDPIKKGDPLTLMTDEELIRGCIKGKESCQYEIYQRYSAKMLGVCLRYCDSLEEAEDVLQDGFIKVFDKMDTFKFLGSFEGWIRRIMVNTAIRNKYTYYRSHETHTLEGYEHSSGEEKITSNLNAGDLMKLINELPKGYKIVFNMFAIEGYSHKEIAEILNIQEATSRSQFLRARNYLKEQLEKIEIK